jgi:hypothetical protein
MYPQPNCHPNHSGAGAETVSQHCPATSFRVFANPTSQTAAALAVFMLAMALYPDVMRKAQAEIDTVVGRHRIPTFADRPHLSYVRAIVKEVLRWRPVGPLGESYRLLLT